MRVDARFLALSAAGLLLAVTVLPVYALTLDARSGLAPALSQGQVVTTRGLPARSEVAGVPVTLVFARGFALDPSTDALLIVAPSVGYTDDEVLALRGFMSSGGRLLVADDRGVGVDLLARLAVGVALTSTVVYSPAFEGDPDRLVTLSTGAEPSFPAEVILSRPALVEGGEPLLLAPELAWLDLNDNGRPDLQEPLRSGALAARAPVGRGELVVVGDGDVFEGSQVELSRVLLASLGEDGARQVVVDEAHRALSDPVGTNDLLAGRLGALPATGILMLSLAVAAAAAFLPRLRRVRRDSRFPPASDEAAAAIQELDP